MDGGMGVAALAWGGGISSFDIDWYSPVGVGAWDLALPFTGDGGGAFIYLNCSSSILVELITSTVTMDRT